MLGKLLTKSFYVYVYCTCVACIFISPDIIKQLLDHIWGYEYAGDTRTVDVHVKRLREKLPENPKWALSTVWGIGYKFESH